MVNGAPAQDDETPIEVLETILIPPLVAQVVLGTSFFLVIIRISSRARRGIEEETVLEH